MLVRQIRIAPDNLHKKTTVIVSDTGGQSLMSLETLKVPSTYRGLRIVYKYDDSFHDDFNVSDELRIEYYD